jgi:hypothetical protein
MATSPTPRARPNGNTRPSRDQTSEPRLPHERDESSDSQQHGEPAGQAVGEQALDDLKSGKVDTDRGPVMDDVYRKTLRNSPPSTPTPGPKRKIQR